MTKIIKLVIIILMTALFYGCNKNSKEDFLLKINQRERYVQENKESYSNVLEEVKKWLQKGCEEDIYLLSDYCGLVEYEVDDLIFFNNNKTRLVGVIKKRSYTRNSRVDYLKGFQGVKIDDSWLLFIGASIILLREAYHYDAYEPLTWEELDYLAYTQYMRKFCKIVDGNIVPLEDGIDKFARIKKGLKYPDGDTEENRIAEYERSRKKKVTPEEKAETLKQIEESKRPTSKVEVPTYTWWQKMKGVKLPLFETEEWKNRRKK